MNNKINPDAIVPKSIDLGKLSNEVIEILENVDALEKVVGEGFTETKTVASEIARVEGIANAAQTADEVSNAIDDKIANLNDASHTHTNKVLLDSYAQTEANLAEAVSKKHEHSNKTELDKFVDGDKARWDAAAQDVEDFFNGALEDGAEQVKDTLREIQDYINSDASAAAEMTASIKAAKDAADAAQTDVDALEGVVATKAAQSDLTALAGRVTTAEGEIDALQTSLAEGGATAQAIAAAQSAADKAQGEVDALEGVVATKATQSDFTAHTGNNNIHVTTDEKAKWNGVTEKANQSDVENDYNEIKSIIEENELVIASSLTELNEKKLDRDLFDFHDNNNDIHVMPRYLVSSNNINLTKGNKNNIFLLNDQVENVTISVYDIEYSHPYIIIMRSSNNVTTNISIEYEDESLSYQGYNIFWLNGCKDITKSNNENESYFEIQLIKYSDSVPWMGVWVEYTNNQ